MPQIHRLHSCKFLTVSPPAPAPTSPDEIPVNAQIICIVDVYDALTTTRSYRGAMSQAEALVRIQESSGWWRPDVYQAFMRTLKKLSEAA